jgi:hypothetical protein
MRLPYGAFHPRPTIMAVFPVGIGIIDGSCLKNGTDVSGKNNQ